MLICGELHANFHLTLFNFLSLSCAYGCLRYEKTSRQILQPKVNLKIETNHKF